MHNFVCSALRAWHFLMSYANCAPSPHNNHSHAPATQHSLIADVVATVAGTAGKRLVARFGICGIGGLAPTGVVVAIQACGALAVFSAWLSRLRWGAVCALSHQTCAHVRP